MAAVPAGPILVVDDDPKILALLRTYLERERYPVATAADGPSALDAIEHLAPRLIVLDLMIPEIDGLEVIRRVRELGDVPILVLSARGSVGDRIVGLTEGADDYLPKPFSPAELVVRVGTILRRSERRGSPGTVFVRGTSSSTSTVTRRGSPARRSRSRRSSCACWGHCLRPTAACWGGTSSSTRSTAQARATCSTAPSTNT